MAKLYKNKQGEKLYPVCKWEENQHKLYNAHDRIMNAIYDAREEKDYDKENSLYEQLEKIEHALEVFGEYVINGLVYATYKDSCIIKDYIWAYNARH